MFSLFTSPKISDSDFYESARNRLTWNIHLFLALALIPLWVIELLNGSVYAYYYGFSALAIGSSVLIMFRTGSFQVISIIVSVLLISLLGYSMFSENEYLHYMEPIWLLVLALYIYFIHGKFWGGLTLFLTFVGSAFYFIFFLNRNVEILNEIDDKRLLAMALEFGVCMSMIGYILHQFIQLKNYAEQELKKVNDALRAEKELVESRNREKTILLQEIHHRVKNNLQIVMSLLRMQSSTIESHEAKEHFSDATNRILTMSLIHQKLYESDDLSAVNLSEYLESLATDILRSNQLPSTVEKTFSVEVQEIGLKTIVPVALIITELISNSAKHAFQSTTTPKISLSIQLVDEDKTLEIIYSDNGKWKESKEDSFGTQLIEALTEQLEGSYDLSKGKTGSTYTFQLKQLD